METMIGLALGLIVLAATLSLLTGNAHVIYDNTAANFAGGGAPSVSVYGQASYRECASSAVASGQAPDAGCG